MSIPTRNAAKSTATVWPKRSGSGVNGYGGNVSYDEPYTIMVCFDKGSSKQYSDNQGVMFTPTSTYWYELPVEGLPKLGDFIALGDHSSADTPQDIEGAESMRTVSQQDCSMVRGIDDVMVLT